jgi:hypothetical protein
MAPSLFETVKSWIVYLPIINASNLRPGIRVVAAYPLFTALFISPVQTPILMLPVTVLDA